MNKKIALALVLAFSIVSTAFADIDVNVDYGGRNFFNRFTDWTATIGKAPDERDRVINERIHARADARRKWHESRHSDDHQDHP